VFSVLAALTCCTLASLGALSRLRAVGRANSYDPGLITKQLASQGAREFVRRLTVAQAEDDADRPWEGELFRVIDKAGNQEEARAGANEILLDVESRFSWGAHVPAACARIALFGALLAAVLLLGRDARLTSEIVDVVALGGSGAMISLMAGSEAQKAAKAKRKAVDLLVDRLLAAREQGGALSASETTRMRVGGEPG